MLASICGLKLKSIGRRLRDAYRAELDWSEDVVRAVTERCNEVDSGARIIDRVLSGTMLPELSTQLLAKLAEGCPVERVSIGWDEAEANFSYEIE